MAPPAAVLAALGGAAWFGGTSTDSCISFRHQFHLPEPASNATVGFVAAGYGSVWINGAKADPSAVLEPAWTQWDKRLLAPVYDVTARLRQGSNVVGLTLAAGWFGHLKNVPAAKLALLINLGKSKRVMTVRTGADWLMVPCPVVQSDIYNGEVYDARKELPGWSSPLPSGWSLPVAEPVPPPAVVANATLSLQQMPPIRALGLLEPTFVTTTKAGATILDFGQNIAGWVQLSLRRCAPGTNVTVRHAEFLIENRTALYTANLRSAKATDVYICKGGPVLHEPSFTYHGFRFVDVSVIGNASWSWADLRARVVHTDVKSRGSLEMESSVLNRIQEAFRWTQLDNLHSVPTDCPQRDERQGWMADAAASAEQALLNFDMRDFYANFLQVIIDAQESSLGGDCHIPVPGGGINGTCLGAVADTSPHVPGTFGGRPADPAWGAALPHITDLMRRYHGQEAAEPFASAVHAWARFLLSMQQDGVVKYHSYGDWLEPGKVASDDRVSEMTAAFNSVEAVRIASLLGNATARAYFLQEFEKLRSNFHRTYWSRTLKCYGDGSQAPQVYALQLGGFSEGHAEYERRALDRLVRSLQTDGLGTGFVSTKWLFPVLSKYDLTALGLRLASSTAFPSWGYMLAKGATTIWEHWDVYHNPSGDSMSSHNHPGFTSVGAWFYTDLVGLRLDREPAELGTTLRGYDALLPSASGQVETPDGMASISWRMRPIVTVQGKCPKDCVVRVPLDGMPVSEALQKLRSQGARSPEACGLAVCTRVSRGSFRFELAAPEASVVV